VSVMYTLTEAGRALLPALDQIMRWAERHLTTRGVGSSATPEPALRSPVADDSGWEISANLGRHTPHKRRHPRMDLGDYAWSPR
jgi:HxlR-like helix-turn-helix